MDKATQETFPLVNPIYIKHTTIGAHWRWGPAWLADAGIMKQFKKAHSLSSDTWPLELWLFIQGLFQVFPEPICLSIDLDKKSPTSTPFWHLIPYMTALTALELKWYKYKSNPDPPEQLSKWLEALPPSQIDQLHHLTLDLSECNATPEEVSRWLEKMPHLHSLTLRDLREIEFAPDDFDEVPNPIALPPFTELQQLHLNLVTIKIPSGR